MKRFTPVLFRVLASLVAGLSFALAFAFPYFGEEQYNLPDKFALVAVPAFVFTFIVYYLIPYAEEKIKGISFSLQLTVFGFAFMAGVFGVLFYAFPPLQLTVNIISLTALFFALIVPAAPFLEKMVQEKNHPRLILGWLLGVAASFFAAGFLGNFYTELYQVVLLILLSQLMLGAFFYAVVGRVRLFAQKSPPDFWIILSLFIMLITFLAMMFRVNSQFPVLFKTDIFLFEKDQFSAFLVVNFISLFWLAWILFRLKEARIHDFPAVNKFIIFIRENLSGLLLSSLFFYLYLLIGSVLNFASFDVDDIFFDSDGFIWRYRLTTEHWQDFYWRSVHPLALLILKPSVNFLSMFLNGDLHFAAVILTAAAGAVCVFFAWMFMKGVLENNTSALIMASLLGLSTSHLFFSSLIETYIFLAAVTLFFFVLMQKKNDSLPLLVSVGVLTMGITLTNFAQIVIALFCAKPNFKFIFKYVFIVVALVVALTLVGNFFYPNASPYFFVPSSFLAEKQNVRAVSLNRAHALVRAFVFNNIAAPGPMMFYKDIPFTQFRFYRAEDYTISQYSTPLQSATEWAWIALLSVAAIFFVRDIKSHPVSLTLALIGCVLLNLMIHLRYGKELFLYSPNWTYAVVLLLGISWKSLLKYRWFQIVLIAFLFLLMLNNAALFYTIMAVSSPYIIQ